MVKWKRRERKELKINSHEEKEKRRMRVERIHGFVIAWMEGRRKGRREGMREGRRKIEVELDGERGRVTGKKMKKACVTFKYCC